MADADLVFVRKELIRIDRQAKAAATMHKKIVCDAQQVNQDIEEVILSDINVLNGCMRLLSRQAESELPRLRKGVAGLEDFLAQALGNRLVDGSK